MGSSRLSPWPGRIHGAVPAPLPAPAWLCPPAPRQLPSLAPFFTLTTELRRDSASFLHHPFDRILLAGDKTLSCAHFTGNQSLFFSLLYFFFPKPSFIYRSLSNPVFFFFFLFLLQNNTKQWIFSGKGGGSKINNIERGRVHTLTLNAPSIPVQTK